MAVISAPTAVAPAAGIVGGTGAAAGDSTRPGTYYYCTTKEAAERLVSGQEIFPAAGASMACTLLPTARRLAIVALCARDARCAFMRWN